MARLGHQPPAQRVLLGRRQRPPRGQSPVEHVGAADRRRPGAGHVALRSGHRDQRRADPGACLERLGLLRRRPAARSLEGGRHPGGAGLRLLVGHRHVARLRPRVGDGAGHPAVPVHDAVRDRDPSGAFGPSRRAPPGRPAGHAVLHFARDPRDVPAPGNPGPAGGDGGGLASGAGACRGTPCPPWGSPSA